VATSVMFGVTWWGHTEQRQHLLGSACNAKVDNLTHSPCSQASVGASLQ